MREVALELNADHSTIIWHLKQIGKVKKLDKWEPRELTTNQKNCRFEVLSSLILCNNHKPFLDQIVMCDEKWILYENQQWPGQWLDREEAPKALSKAKLRPKKGHGHRWSAAHLIYYSFLNPRKTITSEKYAQQIDEMHGKLQGLQPALVNKKGPIILCDNAGLHIKVLRYPPYSSDLLQLATTFSSFLTTFCRKNASTISSM